MYRELIEYDNPSAKRINSGFWSDGEKAAKKLPSLDFDKMKSLETLYKSKLDDFIEAVSSIGAGTNWMHLNLPIGICIKLTTRMEILQLFHAVNYMKNL